MSTLLILWFSTFILFLIFHILAITIESKIIDNLLEFGLMEILVSAQLLFLVMLFFEFIYNFFKLVWII